MRCPNCGMDIVIATHLCPHCGYAHDFDGRIETRHDLPEPWELTPDKAARRREKRERAAAAWARGRAGKVRETEAVRERKAERPGRESYSSRGAAALMHWLALVSLWLMSLLLLAEAALLYSGLYYELTGAGSADWIYSQLPELRNMDQLLSVGLGLAGLLALAAARKTAKREHAASRSFYIAAALFVCSSLLYDLLVYIEYGVVTQFNATLCELIVFAVYALFMALHFRLNSRQYTN